MTSKVSLLEGSKATLAIFPAATIGQSVTVAGYPSNRVSDVIVDG